MEHHLAVFRRVFVKEGRWLLTVSHIPPLSEEQKASPDAFQGFSDGGARVLELFFMFNFVE